MKIYPAMLNVEGRLAVIIGGGNVACRKTLELVEAGAKVKIIAPVVADELLNLSVSLPEIEILTREYSAGDLEGAWIVISATDDPKVNREVFKESDDRKLFINAVDDPPNCSFIVPSVLRRGDLVVSVSTSGASPSIAAKIRKNIENVIPEDIEIILAAFREARRVLKINSVFENLDFNARGDLIKKISSDDLLIENLKKSFEQGRVEEFMCEIADSLS